MKKILILSSSSRKQGNSDCLADAFEKGATRVGHSVEKIYIKDMDLKFCTGCLSCQVSGKCPLQDDVAMLLEKMRTSDVLVFATPIYFYEMSGQMKTLLDRTNPLYGSDYKFEDIYFIASAAEEERSAMDGAIKGLEGWISCFERTQLKGVVYGTGLTGIDDVKKNSSLLQEAMQLGEHV